jgi:hypothetical protein
MKGKKPAVVVIVIIALLAACVSGWMWYRNQQDRPLTLYGNVDIRTVNMSFRVGGRLAALNIDEGDTIKAGEPLGVLDQGPYDNALLQAQANVAAAQAKYDLVIAGYRDEEIAQAAAQVNQAQAFIGVFVFMMPAILLSGYVSPVENMPVWLQNLTWVNPIRHFTDITKQIYLKDASLDIVWGSVWPLLVIAATTGSAAYWMFRRKIA